MKSAKNVINILTTVLVMSTINYGEDNVTNLDTDKKEDPLVERFNPTSYEVLDLNITNQEKN